ncbi:uncharacterized protein [Panulirus ornatus]
MVVARLSNPSQAIWSPDARSSSVILVQDRRDCHPRFYISHHIRPVTRKMISPYSLILMKADRNQSLLTGAMTVLLFVVLVLAGFYSFHHKPHSRAVYSNSYDDFLGDSHFQEWIRQMCSTPLLPPLEYRGLRSLSQYLLSPDHSQCLTWVRLGQLIPKICRVREKEVDGQIKEKYVCANDSAKAGANQSCIIYHFTVGGRTTHPKTLDPLTCVVHSFSYGKEAVQNACVEVLGVPIQPHHVSGTRSSRHHALGGSTSPLHHDQGWGLKFLTTGDLQGYEWSLLRLMMTNHDLLDVGQLSVLLHLPVIADRPHSQKELDYFRQLFQVFEGLTCAGYRLVRSRPLICQEGVLISKE